jgi:para-nitrobenzyl esterase
VTATTGGSWSTASAPEVRVAGGALRGTLESGVAVFRGISSPILALLDDHP